MTIPLTFITRYAIPLIVSILYLGDVDIPSQMSIFDKTSELSDFALSQALNEGDGGTEETFDYIIVGAGSAGAILANRLTASGEFRVLLLEAGGDPNPIYEVPYARKFVFETGLNDWHYRTEKQNKSCFGSDGVSHPKICINFQFYNQVNNFMQFFSALCLHTWESPRR